MLYLLIILQVIPHLACIQQAWWVVLANLDEAPVWMD